MKKILLPALSAFGLLAACSGGTEAPKDEAAAEATAAADDTAPTANAASNDDNDSAKPVADDHPHGEGEGEHKAH